MAQKAISVRNVDQVTVEMQYWEFRMPVFLILVLQTTILCTEEVFHHCSLFLTIRN